MSVTIGSAHPVANTCEWIINVVGHVRRSVFPTHPVWWRGFCRVGYYIPADYGVKAAPPHRRYDRVQNSIRQRKRDTVSGKKAWELGFCEEHHQPKEHTPPRGRELLLWGWVFVAHNAAAVDLKFVVEYCLKIGTEIFPMTTGRKTRQLRIPLETASKRSKRGRGQSRETSTFDPYQDVIWIDSYAFLPFALSRFAKAFGLSQGKGDFPLLLNTPANQNLILDHHPGLSYYNPEDKKPEAYLALTAWHGTVKDEPFHFKEEILRYCQMDVTRIEASTFRGQTHAQFRLPERLPLDFISWEGVLYVAPIPNTPFYADALLFLRRMVLEFTGCYFHGVCQQRQKAGPTENAKQGLFNHKREMSKRMAHTTERKRLLEEAGYEVVSVWECEMKKLMNAHLGDTALLRTPDLPTGRIDIRANLHGGRTKAFGLSCELKDMDQASLHYFDITSLYPFVNLTCKYPVGQATVYLGLGDAYKQDKNLETVIRVPEVTITTGEWCGFAYVRVLPLDWYST
eukprot:CFRG8292T1